MAEFLRSWNNTLTKKTIHDFVATVTDKGSPDYERHHPDLWLRV